MAKRRRKNPLLTVVTNPPEMSDQVQSLAYRHNDDGEEYIHQFRPGVTMRPKADGSVELRHAEDLPLHEKVRSGQRFLINPPRKRGATMAHRLRYTSGSKKGQFRKKGSSSGRKKTRRITAKTRKRSTSRRRSVAAPARRRRRRNNPPKLSFRNVTKDLMQGSIDAALILVGKATTRMVPAMIPNVPRQGNMGLAMQALTAVGVALLAQQFLKPAQAKMILAGGLTAPVETLVVSLDVPFLADALAPVTADQQLSAYMGAYVQPEIQLEAGQDIGAYVQEGADLALAGYDYAAHM